MHGNYRLQWSNAPALQSNALLRTDPLKGFSK
jgi:hypothetical protein